MLTKSAEHSDKLENDMNVASSTLSQCLLNLQSIPTSMP